MSARELLASTGSGGKIIDTQTFTASGTWTKPAGALPTDLVIVDLWGGGGGGGHQSSSQSGSGGAGGGGGHNRVSFRAFELASSETVTVGAGGAGGVATSATTLTFGVAGGYSEFKGNRAYGGGRGGRSYGEGSSGGGIYSAGNQYADNSNIDPAGGEPQSVFSGTALGFKYSQVSYSNVTWITYPGEWGGMSYPSTTAGNNLYANIGPIHGGGCGSSYGDSSAKSKSSVWGGGGGGVWSGTANAEMQAGGISVFGGNGGAAATAINTPGGNGSPRGGGGGGGNGTGKGGDGGRGEVKITVVRGA